MPIYPKPLPSLETLAELIDYDALTGEMRWKITGRENNNERRGRFRVVGDLIGTPTTNGYLSVRVNKQGYLAHRIAFAMSRGREPEGGIDHIDGNRTNNAASNLREAEAYQNQQNMKGWSKLAKGVYLHGIRKAKPYCAKITLRGSVIRLGAFETVEEASAAYQKAARTLFGEFATSRHSPFSSG